jgi:putative ABC transport system permease protein
VVQALRSAVRSLRAVPAFTATVILTIATGTGICTAVFSVLHGIARPDLPYRAPDRLMVLRATMNRQVRVGTEWLTPEQLQLWREAPSRWFAGVSAFSLRDAVVENVEGGTTRVQGAAVDGDFFRLPRAVAPEFAAAATPWFDVRVLAFVIALTLLTTLLLALQPALRLRRIDVIAGLRRGAGVATSTAGERRTRDCLVTAQVALALVLVAAAAIVAKSLANYRSLDVGYDVERLVVAIPEYDFDTWPDARQRQLGEMFLDRFSARGDIEAAAIWRFRTAAWPPPPQDALFALGGNEQLAVPAAFLLQSYYEVSPGFFRTLGVGILAGRDFLETDGPAAEPVAIVMETAARVWFGSETAALGRRVRIGPAGSEWLRIIGIVPDLPRISTFGRQLATRRRTAYLPWLFRPIAQAGDTPPANWPRRPCLDCAQLAMAVRVPDSGADPYAIARVVAAELRAFAPDLAVQPGPFLEQQMNGYAPALLRRNRAALLAFAALALGLALLGQHAIVADAVARRTREIGIRIALGARPADVVRTVARDSVLVAAAGTGIGVLLIALATALTNKLFFAGGYAATLVGSSATDPYVVAPAAAAILLAAAVTAVAGARRAARLQPGAALRVD